MRDELAINIKKLILGPYNGEEEELTYKPLNLYTTGVLYPQIVNENLRDTDQNEDDNQSIVKKNEDDESENEKTIKSKVKTKESSEDDDNINDDDELKLATNFAPSSMGFSFIVNDNTNFNLSYCFGRYVKSGKVTYESKWKRIPYESEINCSINDGILFINNQKSNEKVLVDEQDYKVKLNFFSRNAGANDSFRKLITITLINSVDPVCNSEQRKDENCVFQPQLKIKSQGPVFLPFPDNTDYGKLENDYEALNTALLYREYKVYAMGHGVSVDWVEDSKQKLCSEIRTEIMPEEEVKGVSFDILGNFSILEMKRLSGVSFNPGQKDSDLKSSLQAFVNEYSIWINKQEGELEKLNIHENVKSQGKKNLEICNKLSARIKKGIELIFSDSKIKQAFFDANKAMFKQRVMGSFASWRRGKNVIPGTDKYEDMSLPVFLDLPSEGIDKKNINEGEFHFQANWRPFQLAFILSQIEGIIDPKCDDRDTTDLIWFPTGGGKTEAYLGLIAFTLFYRRLREEDPNDGAGVAVMMRYTLRMLNLDQFQRANLLIAACEMIRYNNSKDYGNLRFSSGIWVGRSLTPNKYIDNQNNIDYGYNSNLDNYIKKIENNDSSNVMYSPFLFNCPCCGNRLVKEKKGGRVVGEWGYFRYFKNGDKKDPKGNYVVSCTNKKCHFFTEKTAKEKDILNLKSFPFYTVDEEIYRQRPSLLFATVDKYAQISWKRESASLFNLDIDQINNQIYAGPELVIQDELHLIGSSLGTIYGLFEYAIDKLCSLKGIKPKIVGATATVKNADEQCKRLYNRKEFMQFPPPGISADDSFFMKKNDEDKKPRKYVGFMSSGFTSSTAIIRLASVLIEAPNVFKNVSNDKLDKYYTLLVYFNSLKELGKFRTFIDDDIYANRKFLTSQVMHKIHQNYSGRDIELSSAMTADQVTSALEQLKKHILKSENKIDDERLLKIKEKGIRSVLDWIETTNKSEIMNPDLIESLGINSHCNKDKTPLENFKLKGDALKALLTEYYNDNINAEPVKIATATNMIATGVDIPRLNVMLVNGHPKSSSEYIQASSRVGREDAGLILSFYSATKNRDRSHYENYKSFHQAFYKYVEPASVTPHSEPAMEKIVPSIIIALAWIMKRKSSNEPFKYDIEMGEFIDGIENELKQRLGTNVEKYLSEIIQNIKRKWEAFNPPERRFAHFGDYMQYPLNTISRQEVLDVRADYMNLAGNLLPKVSTMRDVEASCQVKIKKDNKNG